MPRLKKKTLCQTLSKDRRRKRDTGNPDKTSVDPTKEAHEGIDEVCVKKEDDSNSTVSTSKRHRKKKLPAEYTKTQSSTTSETPDILPSRTYMVSSDADSNSSPPASQRKKRKIINVLQVEPSKINEVSMSDSLSSNQIACVDKESHSLLHESTKGKERKQDNTLQFSSCPAEDRTEVHSQMIQKYFETQRILQKSKEQSFQYQEHQMQYDRQCSKEYRNGEILKDTERGRPRQRKW